MNVLLILLAFEASFVQGLATFRSIECSSSNKTVAPDFRCFIKSYSRTNTTINFYINLLKPVYSAMVRFDFSHAYLTQSYRSVINTTVDVCGFLNGTSTHPAIQWMIDSLKHLIKPEQLKLIHSCPYQGIFKVDNIYVDSASYNTLLPNGIYKTVMTYFNDEDDQIFVVKVVREATNRRGMMF